MSRAAVAFVRGLRSLVELVEQARGLAEEFAQERWRESLLDAHRGDVGVEDDAAHFSGDVRGAWSARFDATRLCRGLAAIGRAPPAVDVAPTCRADGCPVSCGDLVEPITEYAGQDRTRARSRCRQCPTRRAAAASGSGGPGQSGEREQEDRRQHPAEERRDVEPRVHGRSPRCGAVGVPGAALASGDERDDGVDCVEHRVEAAKTNLCQLALE